MLIELIGCTSAGKSTLSAAIQRACRQQGISLWRSDEFVLSQVKLNWIKNRIIRTLLLDVLAFLACLRMWPKHRSFFGFASSLLWHLPIGKFERLNLIRNVYKKIGLYEWMMHFCPEEVLVLVDEGTLQAAHNLFVHVDKVANPSDLATFAQLVPLPDVALYLQQSEATLVTRTRNRTHNRIPATASLAQVTEFIRQAVTAFDVLVEHPRVGDRTLVLDQRQNVAKLPGRPLPLSFKTALEMVQEGLSYS